MSGEEHWESIYRSAEPEQVSWYRPRLDRSLALLSRLEVPAEAHVVDVGAGASTFVDDLLARGHERVTVVDLSGTALEKTRARLGEGAARVTFVQGDATEPLLAPDSVDVWHDRACFHFLNEPGSRARYVAQVLRALRRGGLLVVATFSPEGPERCSGLPVTRYAPDHLAEVLGPELERVAEAREVHETPRGVAQSFCYLVCRRR